MIRTAYAPSCSVYILMGGMDIGVDIVVVVDIVAVVDMVVWIYGMVLMGDSLYIDGRRSSGRSRLSWRLSPRT